jgi:hypothetical protein
MSIVTEILLCRRICITTRGWTSSSTSKKAHVRRVECTDTTGTPALLACALNRRWKFRGSSGRPWRVLNTRSFSCQALPASVLQCSTVSRCAARACTQGSGNGSTASEEIVLVGRSTSHPSIHCSCDRICALPVSKSMSAHRRPRSSPRLDGRRSTLPVYLSRARINTGRRARPEPIVRESSAPLANSFAKGRTHMLASNAKDRRL